ncbi:MAG: hypothetical protein Ct9H300mP16_07370 [Pseudomonadota bacterium]|nr:MAG: hypothetical protein Ct9H300mP16_07370 [Pseudomonadota bacterium]
MKAARLLARSFSEAGASIVFAGEAESWRHWPERENLQSIANVELVPLDVSDTQSVEELCGEIGGKVDILVNNARFVRPGGVVDGGNLVFAQKGNGSELSRADAPCSGVWPGDARPRC